MPRPKKNQATFTNNDGAATTPELKIKTKEQQQLEALQLCVATLQVRVGALEARQNPNPVTPMAVFGQPHPMYMPPPPAPPVPASSRPSY